MAAFIHSFVRLAEESARDREKIENTLLSYVRENSWVERNGVVVAPWPAFRNSSWEWNYAYSIGKVSTESATELRAWEERQAKQSKEKLNWAKSLKETRVDVNEAIDAIPKVHGELRAETQLRFYECLFVGARFEPQLLNLCRFDRCTFAKCTFAQAQHYNFSSCEFIDCSIREVSAGSMSFSRCTIVGLTIGKLFNTSLRLISSNASDLVIHNAEGGKLDLAYSTLHKAWISGDGEIELNLKHAALAGGRIKGIKVSSCSDFVDSALANTRLEGVDLSAIRLISDATLATAGGDPATRHPEALTRPFAWDNYDPNYKDDDIPF